MLNIPGTLLFVRKRIPLKNGYEPGTIYMKDVYTHNFVVLMYSDTCVLMELSNPVHKNINEKLQYIKVLWKNRIVYNYFTKNAINKMFALENAWYNHKHHEHVITYHNNGTMKTLKKYVDFMNQSR